MSGADPEDGASLLVHGACHCGAVRLTARIQPSRILVCHCTDCQVLTGSAFRVVAPVVPGSLEVQGAVKEYARTADSGAVRLQVFCPECGTPVYARSAGADGMATVRVGILAERQALTPVTQLWRRSALPWVDRLAGVAGCERQELLG